MDNIIKNLKITKEERKSMIDQRLTNYKRRIYDLHLDYVAYEAVVDTESMKATKDRIESIVKAHDAVANIKIEG